ncbi:MAG: bifunctional diguanylate cyclase/phosphodiesterase [Pseudomonadota bacterium]
MFFWIAALLGVGVTVTGGQLWATRRQLRTLRREHAHLETQSRQLHTDLGQDDLTPTQSRRYLADRIDRTERTTTDCLLYVDLDDFKTVNDGYGHEVGDSLLIKISQALIDTCRENDFVARLGGDEFCVYLHDCTLNNAQEVAGRFRAAVAQAQLDVRGVQVKRSASIGVTELHPDQSMVDALYIADAALYEAKASGRNRVQPADQKIFDQLARRRDRPTSEDVAQALLNDEITYYVQPIFDLNTDTAIGVEALLRWVVPDESHVRLPDAFLDVMTANYKMDMKPPLDAANRLANTFTTMTPPLFVAWNISSSFLGRSVSNDTRWLDELLMGVDPAQTVFEIVESAVIDNPDHTKRLLNQLREAGVRVALDDFGTGLSNLERLTEYPIDIVKIDRSFVNRLDRNSNPGILKGLAAMGRQIGFDVIAEGVETQWQLDVLRSIGITKAQGHFLGRPQSVDYWHRYIASGHKSR